MAHRSPARWLAPLALVVCAVAVFAVIQNGRSSGGSGSSMATVTSAKGKSKATISAGKRGASATRKRIYVVKSGDVLSSIAASHGTTVQAIQALNPSLDAAALHIGQKIRLPR